MLHSLPSSHSPDAAPLPPPSATLQYTQHPLMSPGYDETPNSNRNPSSCLVTVQFNSYLVIEHPIILSQALLFTVHTERTNALPFSTADAALASSSPAAPLLQSASSRTRLSATTTTATTTLLLPTPSPSSTSASKILPSSTTIVYQTPTLFLTLIVNVS